MVNQFDFNKAFNWILNDKYRIPFHLLFWMVMYMDEFFALIGITEPYESEYIKYILLEIGLDILLVYFNLYVLIPVFLLKNKTGLLFYL